jgi:UDP-glucose 4-epimerase
VFLAQLLAGKPLTIVGDGEQTRDFTYVSDAVDALICAAESHKVRLCVNVGSDNPVSVNTLVRLLKAPATVNIPKRPGEPDCTFADTTRIKAELGWKSRVAIEEGVHNMLNAIDYWRDAPVWTSESIAEATKDWFTYLGRR